MTGVSLTSTLFVLPVSPDPLQTLFLFFSPLSLSLTTHSLLLFLSVFFSLSLTLILCTSLTHILCSTLSLPPSLPLSHPQTDTPLSSLLSPGFSLSWGEARLVKHLSIQWSNAKLVFETVRQGEDTGQLYWLCRAGSQEEFQTVVSPDGLQWNFR